MKDWLSILCTDDTQKANSTKWQLIVPPLSLVNSPFLKRHFHYMKTTQDQFRFRH